MKIIKTIRKKFKTKIPSEMKHHEHYYDDDSETEKNLSEEFDAEEEEECDSDCPISTSRRSIRGATTDEEERRRRRQRPRVRLVTFDEGVLVRRIRPVYEIGGAINKRELWYQDDEYKEITWKSRRSIKRARDSNNIHHNGELRGLEYVMTSRDKRESNLDGREAVLDEQFSQFEEDVFPLDDDAIARVYLPFTKQHRAEALQRARNDAVGVERYQREPTSDGEPSHRHPSDGTPRMPPRVSSMASISSLNSSSVRSVSSTQQTRLVNKPGMVFTYQQVIDLRT